MIELALNSNISAMTVFAPFKLNHSYMPQVYLPVNTDTTSKGVLQFIQQAQWSLMAAQDAILVHHVDHYMICTRYILKYAIILSW
jgi:predicted permease